MKILVACRKFDGVVGGVERMSTTLMNELVKKGHDVHLFTWDHNEDAKSFYPIDPSISWTKLAMGNPKQKASLSLRLKRMIKVRSYLKQLKPDIVLGFQEGSFVTLKLYGLGLRIPMICAIRESPFRYKHIKATPPFDFTCQILRLSAAITVQFERYGKAFPAYLSDKIKITPNHIYAAHKLANPTGSEKTILSTGRLSYEKNHACLIKAFAKIAPEFPDWTLKIIGKGDEHQKLWDLSKSYGKGILSQIQIPGPTNNVQEHLEHAQIYCLPSRWEGFPNALAEAMAHGLPSIVFENCDGASDLIDHNINGLHAAGTDNIDSLADALKKLISSPELRIQLGKNAKEKADQFAPEKMIRNWENILKEAAKK